MVKATLTDVRLISIRYHAASAAAVAVKTAETAETEVAVGTEAGRTEETGKEGEGERTHPGRSEPGGRQGEDESAQAPVNERRAPPSHALFFVAFGFTVGGTYTAEREWEWAGGRV